MGKRYKPDIKWSKESWTHNIFRVYELVFWRKIGIRPEMRSSAYEENGRIVVEYELYSFEALCAFIETWLRDLPKRSWKKYKLVSFNLSPSGIKSPSIPLAHYAIALDVASNFGTSTGSGTSPITWSHTCTGSNLLLAVGAGLSASTTTAPSIGTVSYNSVNMTQAAEVQDTVTLATDNGIYFLGGPASGAHTVSVAFSGGVSPSAYAGAVSYTGAQSSSTKDANNTATGTGTGDKTVSVTTVADNCWIFCVMVQVGSTGTITADQTSRYSSGLVNQAHIGGEDTNAAKTPAGSYTMGWTVNTLGTNWSLTIASFAPAAAATASSRLRSLLGVGL